MNAGETVSLKLDRPSIIRNDVGRYEQSYRSAGTAVAIHSKSYTTESSTILAFALFRQFSATLLPAYLNVQAK